MLVHHAPFSAGLTWNLHAWQLSWNGNAVWDVNASASGALIDFQFPDVPDPRWLQFLFRATTPQTGSSVWESDSFARQIVDPTAAEIWTFGWTARILTQDPTPAG